MRDCQRPARPEFDHTNTGRRDVDLAAAGDGREPGTRHKVVASPRPAYPPSHRSPRVLRSGRSSRLAAARGSVVQASRVSPACGEGRRRGAAALDKGRRSRGPTCGARLTSARSYCSVLTAASAWWRPSVCQLAATRRTSAILRPDLSLVSGGRASVFSGSDDLDFPGGGDGGGRLILERSVDRRGRCSPTAAWPVESPVESATPGPPSPNLGADALLDGVGRLDLALTPDARLRRSTCDDQPHRRRRFPARAA
jgi:hypothetical protein